MEKFLNFNKKLVDAYNSSSIWIRLLTKPLMITYGLLLLMVSLIILFMCGIVSITCGKDVFKDCIEVFKVSFWESCDYMND